MRSTLFATAVLLALLASPLAADGPRWAPLGPGGGSVISLAVNPANPDVIHVATGTRAYRSLNGGFSWGEVPGLGAVSRIVLDPSRPTTLYALSFSQLRKSVDGGATWTPAGPPGPLPDNPLRTLAIDPARPSRLYLGTILGVWRSDNGGVSWLRVNRGLGQGDGRIVTSLAVSRQPSGTVFAGTPVGLFKTTNAGGLWTRVDGLPTEEVDALAVSPSDPRFVYARLFSGFYRSRDGGQSWQRAVNPAATHVEDLVVHPRFPRTVFAATSGDGLLRSNDFGQTWTPLLPDGTVVLAVSVHSRPSGDLLYVGTSPWGLNVGGVAVSLDGGARWSVRNRGLFELRTNVVATDGDALLTGTNGQGLFRVVNPNGPLWSRTPAGFPHLTPSLYVNDIVHGGPGLFYAMVAGDLWRTADAGVSWTRVPGFSGPLQVAADPGVAATAYALTIQGHFDVGFFRTTDAGASWTPLAPPPLDCGFRDLAVAPSSPPGARVLYAAGAGETLGCQSPPAKVFRSSDGGASWVDASAGLPNQIAGPLAVDPLDPNVVYVGIATLSALKPFGVWKSVDGGATWAQTGALPLRVSDLVVPPIPGRVYAATELSGIFRSDDGGATWRLWNEGISATQILDLALDPGDPSRLYAATNGGVWALKEID